MAKLRHLAILTHQPDKLADFYKRVFDMKEMYRTKNGSVHLSDGEEIYPEGAPKAREATYAEGRGCDPDGNLFDISTVGWGLTRRMDL